MNLTAWQGIHLDKDNNNRTMKNYSFNLISGRFTKEDAQKIVTGLVDVKIKYHEEKIRQSDSEEDIKMREKKIKELQMHLYEFRRHIKHQNENIELTGGFAL